MKSPADLAKYLARQWHKSSFRLERLLSADSWPWTLPIGKPTAAEFAKQSAAVQAYVEQWKAVRAGLVEWQEVKYRTGADAVLMPVQWRLETPSDWVTATADTGIKSEYKALEYLIPQSDPAYWELLISERSLWRKKDLGEVVAATQLADALTPGCAKGRPLRLLAGHGVDTKFFERNANLVTKLLDERYEGAVSEEGLVNFLDAFDENDHWVLVVPLEQQLLPFRRLRLTTRELSEAKLPHSRILVVENERCEHLLPHLPDTVAILGAGLDLQWLQSDCFDDKIIGYWGDMDTWGLLMLARAREYRPQLIPLLMNSDLFDRQAHAAAVVEPVCAQQVPPEGLSASEKVFYRRLMSREKGRLEQEYLPEIEVQAALKAWASDK